MPNGGRSKSSSTKTARRREELRRSLPRRTFDFRTLVQQPEFVNAALVTVAFLILTSALVILAREQVKVQDGQIMTDTRLNRLNYRVPDLALTDAKREEVRKSAPQVYELNTSYLDRLAASLNGLPIAVAGKTAIAELSPKIKDEFELTDAGLRALAPFSFESETTPEWRSWVDNLVQYRLPSNPLMSKADYQNHWVEREYSKTLKRLLSRPTGDMDEIANDTRAIELLGEAPVEREPIQQMVLRAGFPPEVVPYVVSKIVKDATPTIYFDAEATAALAKHEAEAVATIYIEHRKGDIIYRRGDVLTLGQYEELVTENQQFAALAPAAERWLPKLAVIGLMTIVSAFMVGYIVLFYPRIARNPVRILALCSLSAAMLGLTVIVGVRAPSVAYLGAVAPTIFVAMVALLAYDQRMALFICATQCALAVLALEMTIGLYLLLFAGCGVAVAQLREMRHRSTLIQASAITGGVLAIGAVLLGMLETPDVTGMWKQVFSNGFWAGFGGFAVGFVVLGILPSLEKWFDITTGMTLAELRDPKQPLLKQLQQKAAGTYNHSLQVANIAEAAAESIGASGLLVYVGALYHDIGKMNKPEYFIENKTGTESKHDKLSPAMSLLVIVGHVKDGIELAKEYGLPRQIQHFIESHHGTTLVEYFYHAAKTHAETHDRGTVDEIEFRYPGPKPRTKEAAILMLADAVESATRSMAEPNPARIESLVRQLSRKRLTDGQYDQCDLTFKELGLIEESAIKSLCAIYHGRISYPGQREREQKEAQATGPTAPTPEQEPAPARQASA